MKDDPSSRAKLSDYESELKIAKSFDEICRQSGDEAFQQLTELKAQLLDLFLQLERGELSCRDAKAQGLRVQEELSKLIWAVNDWQTQFASRN